MAPTTRIRVLPEAVVNKIAAGEVVDRPASVLKELLENALDAGARSVRVRVEGSSGRLISVADDGCGMGADDALLALERHATSKITSASDLERVATMGFRGEALPSIAAVSRMLLETRRAADEVGTRVEVTGGRVASVVPAARPPGTTVTVRQLFFNTPARRKFLRSAPTEKGHLLKAFLRAALANPAVRLEMVYDGAELFVLPAAELARRVADVLGPAAAGSLAQVEAGAEGMSLGGYVVDPERPGAGGAQYFFVNGRPVEDRVLQGAVRDAFGRRGLRSVRPEYLLYLRIEPALVDVNVHPAKREVRFSRPSAVSGLVAAALDQGLRASAAPRPASTALFRVPGAPVPGASAGAPSPPPCAAGTGTGQKASRAAEPPLPGYRTEAAAPFPAPPAPERGGAAGPGDLVYFGQVLGGYLLASSSEGLVIVDQHAAHERVLFERVLDRLASRKDLSQNLLFPLEWEVQPQVFPRISSLLPLMERFGCRLEPFGRRSFRVTSLPPEVPFPEVVEFLGNLAELLEEADEATRAEPAWWEKPAAVIACHGAVKMGDPLEPASAASLLADLAACREPRRCPHGRPTMVSLDRQGLEKLFGRR